MSTEHKNLCYGCFQERPEGGGPCPHCGYDAEKEQEKYPMALLPGSILSGRYVVGRVLGQGGFGITYLALDHQLRMRAAIKEFFPEQMAVRKSRDSGLTVYSGSRGENYQSGMESFLDEAKTLAKFAGNPNIVGVSSYFEENGTAYFVMEYVDGISFKTYIRNCGGKISWEDAKRILLPVMKALEAVHREGVIHRDVTPDNIYITDRGEIKLLDFGSARYSLGDKSHSLDVVLKAGYAPKEQYTRRGKQGTYTDVYSVAACFYASLTGFLPPEALDRMEEDTLIPPGSRGVVLPPEAEQAILKGLSVYAGDRFQTMEEFRLALAGGMSPEPGPAPWPGPNPVPPGPGPNPNPLPPGPGPNPNPVPPGPGPNPNPLPPGPGPNPNPVPPGPGSNSNPPDPWSGPGRKEDASGKAKRKKRIKTAGILAAGAAAAAISVCLILNRNAEKTVTYPSGEVYTGEIKRRERNGYGTCTWPNGDVYEGEWKNEQRNGQGTYTWKSGDLKRYKGEWFNNKRNGYGTMQFRNGEEYTGEWSDNQMSGHGIYTWYSGETYEGDWKDGSRLDGQGTFTWVDGTSVYGKFEQVKGIETEDGTYEGMYMKDQANGSGILTYMDDGALNGIWKDGKPCGRGTYTWPDGETMTGVWSCKEDVKWQEETLLGACRYSGLFCDGTMNGFGVLTDEQGENSFYGSFRNGLRDGKGFMLFKTGSVYVGEWKADKPDGAGSFIWADDNSDPLDGEWSYVKEEELKNSSGDVIGTYSGFKQGENYCGYGKMIFADGEMYEGEWLKNVMDGYGFYSWPDGDRYEGSEKEGKKHGYGIYIWEDGSRFEGGWREDKRSGSGVLISADGTVRKGEWRDGAELEEPEPGGSWKQEGRRWWYQTADGKYLKSGWWLIEGKAYCFDDKGWLYTDTTTPDGYIVDKNGVSEE